LPEKLNPKYKFKYDRSKRKEELKFEKRSAVKIDAQIGDCSSHRLQTYCASDVEIEIGSSFAYKLGLLDEKSKAERYEDHN